MNSINVGLVDYVSGFITLIINIIVKKFEGIDFFRFTNYYINWIYLKKFV